MIIMLAILILLIALILYFLGKVFLHIEGWLTEKEEAKKEAEDKKKYPGSKPWI